MPRIIFKSEMANLGHSCGRTATENVSGNDLRVVLIQGLRIFRFHGSAGFKAFEAPWHRDYGLGTLVKALSS